MRSDGPTAAIRFICNPEFLPQLERLLLIVFDPDFEDCSWFGLRSSLNTVFVNCGAVAYEETVQVIMNHRPSVDVNEDNYRYCNFLIEEIKQARKSLFDKPKTLLEVKAFLIETRKYY